MSEVLKELLLNPICFGLLLVTFLIYTSFLLKYGSTKEGAAKLEKIWLFVFLLAITGISSFPLNKLVPSALSDVHKTSTSAALELVIYAYIILILNLRFRRFFLNALSIFKNPCLGILLLLAPLSAIWSPTPFVTLKYGIVLVGISAFAAHVASQYSWQEISGFLRWTNTIVGLISVKVVLLQPSVGLHEEDHRWQGALAHPIYLGTLMALNTAMWYSYSTYKPKHRWIAIAIAFFSFVVMLFTRSAGGFFNFFVLISLVELLRFIRRLNFAQAFIALTLFVIVGTAVSILLSGNVDSLLGVFGKDTTLTGRTDIWPQIVEAIKQHPLLGHGYKGFWQAWQGSNDPAAFIAAPNGWHPPHAHNGFLDTAVDLGMIGLLLFVISFLQNVVQGVLFLSRTRIVEATVPLILLVFFIMANISDSNLLEPQHTWFYYVLVTVRLGLDTKEIRFSKRRTFQEPAS